MKNMWSNQFWPNFKNIIKFSSWSPFVWRVLLIAFTDEIWPDWINSFKYMQNFTKILFFNCFSQFKKILNLHLLLNEFLIFFLSRRPSLKTKLTWLISSRKRIKNDTFFSTTLFLFSCLFKFLFIFGFLVIKISFFFFRWLKVKINRSRKKFLVNTYLMIRRDTRLN